MLTIKEIKNKILPILKKHDVSKASLFGSITTGQVTEESDIDLLVSFEGEKSLLDLAGLKIELEQVLERKVDVLTYHSVHHLLRDRILEQQKAII